MSMQKVPILVVAFNRPEMVKMAMEPIRQYQPDKLYFACDGPRKDRDGEPLLVAETQKTMMDAVDWPCEVKTLFREGNLGCAKAVYEAISCFFEHEEFGIIIEDDVIVSLDFFKMCEELLPRYNNDSEIMHISAMNFNNRQEANTYTFQKKPFVWGWATWRRAWAKMDMDMKAWSSFKMKSLIKYYGWFQTMMMWRYWNYAYNHIETISSWATRWHFSVVSYKGLCICPRANLSINVGCSTSGTHYHSEDIDPYSHLKIGKLVFPLVHPERIALDYAQLKLDNRDFLRVRILGAKKRILRLFHVK